MNDDNAALREQLVDVRATLGQAHALMARLASGERERCMCVCY